jgi:hypothetical protein
MLKSEIATQMDLKTTNIEILNKMSMTTNPNINTNTNTNTNYYLRKGNHSVFHVIVNFVAFQIFSSISLTNYNLELLVKLKCKENISLYYNLIKISASLKSYPAL